MPLPPPSPGHARCYAPQRLLLSNFVTRAVAYHLRRRRVCDNNIYDVKQLCSELMLAATMGRSSSVHFNALSSSGSCP
jgi:hypothetical protein